MKLEYSMKTMEGTHLEGDTSFEGALHLVFPVHEETIDEIKAVVKIDVSDDEKIFI